jgi:thioredoxin reductase
MNNWDAIIIGAGPAGLSAALVLGRCCRQVLLCDRGTPRNRASHAINGFIARDGIDPAEFRRTALAELERYPGVHFRPEEILQAYRTGELEFAVRFAAGDEVRARKLLLATGVEDELPRLKGLEQFFGSSVFQCPYCDGWEVRNGAVAVYGRERRGFEAARALTAWTQDIVLCTDGPAGLSSGQRRALERNAIVIETEPIAELLGHDGALAAIRLASGRELSRSALFFDTPTHPQSKLAESLGCELTPEGGIRCGQYEATSVPGVFVAGNIVKDVQLSIVAAAEGARAAFGLNRALTREDFRVKVRGKTPVEHPTVP